MILALTYVKLLLEIMKFTNTSKYQIENVFQFGGHLSISVGKWHWQFTELGYFRNFNSVTTLTLWTQFLNFQKKK